MDAVDKNSESTTKISPPRQSSKGKKLGRGSGGATGRGFQPGVCPNPGGRPKRDLAAEIARAVFEKNPEEITLAMFRGLKKADPRIFAVLADRGFGKLTEKVEVSGELGIGEKLAAARRRVKEKSGGS